MSFYEKLTFLMNLYKVSNNKLAREINVDPSLVSRWKSGSRTPSSNSPHIRCIAEYFLRLNGFPQQKAKLLQTLSVFRPHSNPEDTGWQLSALTDWLNASGQEQKPGSRQSPSENQQASTAAIVLIKGISQVMSSLHDFNSPSVPPSGMSVLKEKCRPGEMRQYELFTGREGKRQAVINFLYTVLASEEPLELLLTSQEDIRWMTESREFLLHWAQLLKAVIEKGHKITLIHVVNRDPSEIVGILHYWMPLHLTGKIHSYYYPRYMETRSKSTYFIIRNKAAVVSFAAEGQEGSSLTFFFQSSTEAAVFEASFTAILSECKPLFTTYAGKSRFQFLKQLAAAEARPCAGYSAKSGLNPLFLQESVLEEKLRSAGMESIQIREYMEIFRGRKARFHENLRHFRQIEILPLELLDEIHRTGMYAFPETEMCTSHQIRLEGSEMAEYMESLIETLVANDDYEIVLSGSSASEYRLLIDITLREGYCAAFSAVSEGKQVAIILHEGNILRSLELYFEDYLQLIPSANKSKNWVIPRIRKLLSALTSGF